MKDQIDNTGNDVALEQCLDYWKIRLANPPTLELPTDRPRPAVPSFSGKIQQFSLSGDLFKDLKLLSQREDVTLFMVLVSAFQVLLHRYSGQDDIVIGTSNARRSHSSYSKAHEGWADLFDNILLLRIDDISGGQSFHELLMQMREVIRQAYENQNIPIEKLLETLNLQHDHIRNPLSQVMFIFQSLDDDESQLKTAPEFSQIDTKTTFDLSFTLSENPDGLTGSLEYATDLFDTTTIERLIGHFQMLLEGIVAHPETHLSEFSLLTESERQQLLIDWNNTVASFPKDKCMHELFEEQVAKTPQAVAVVHEGKQLTYTELNAQANQLARHLRELGVKPDVMVAICVQRSLNMLVGLLAILKAGGAYVPLNPAYPSELLTTIVEDSAPIALLTQSRLENLFVGVAKTLPVIDLDNQSPPWTNQPSTNLDCLDVGLTPTHLAYVIYTSGSTGKPKGVMIEHRGVCSMITDIRKRYAICATDRMLQFSPIAFDVSVQEIFITLSSGAGLVLRSDDWAESSDNWLAGASNFWALCEKNGVTVVKLPTAFWQQLIQEEQVTIPSTIRLNIIGGEAVNSNVLATWFERKSHRPKLFNAYGPTETTVNSTIHETSAEALSWQSIGRPIANTRIYILDANKQPVPIGVAGELYIGGVGVARGYLKRPELTAEQFFTDPFAEEVGARMYKTGDLVRWLSDGTIEYLGRNDFQVKIRGFRIELGHIEAKMIEHPAISKVAVLAHEDSDRSKRLVAYVVPKDNFIPSVHELRDFLKNRMPEFMVPSAFMFLDTLPLTLNGKLNRKALPEPDFSHHELDANFVAPRNQVEKQLAEIWCNVLKTDRVSIHDNFFELGGHSLLAVKMIVEVNKLLNLDLPLGIIYQYPTVEELAASLSSGNQQPSRYSLVPIRTQGSRPPLFAIHTITLEGLPRYLGKEQPLYFLRYAMAAGISDRPVQLPPLEELASHYIKEMQLAQPQGPYHLIGFSFGGLIAYEMACQLLANGHQVNLIGLLDTFLTKKRRMKPLHRIIHKLPIRALEIVKNKITDLVTPDKTSTDFWPHAYTPEPDRASRSGYEPKSYNGRVILFQGSEMESKFFIHHPPEQAWKELLGDNLEVQQIHGSHYEIFDEPHVKLLAEKIMAAIDKTINQQLS